MLAPPRRAARARAGRASPTASPNPPNSTHHEPTTNQTYTVTPAAATTQATTSALTYTVTGLTAGTAVRIALVDPAFISGNTFTPTGGNRLADLTPPSSTNVVIDRINGLTVTGASAVSFTPTTTSITFQVDSISAAGVEAVPVVFKDNTANTLSVNLDGVPTTQAFGIGGQVTFTPAAATQPAESASGTIASSTVTHVYGATGFTNDPAATPTYQWLMRAGDTYMFGTTDIGLAKFLTILSVGDTVTGTYVKGATATTPSTFTITADHALAIAAAPAVTTVKGAVTLTYTPSQFTSANGTKFQIDRRTFVSGVWGPWTTVKTASTITSLTEQTFTETLTDGTYQYNLLATAPAFSGTAAVEGTSTPFNVVVSPTAAAPAVQRLYLTSNATNINNLNKGDVFKIAVTAPITQPVLGATLTLNNGADHLFTNAAASSSNAPGDVTITVNTATEVVDGVTHAAGTVITVTLLADPVGGVMPFSTVTHLTTFTGLAGPSGTLTNTVSANATLTQDVVV